MEKKNDGGPAFPLPVEDPYCGPRFKSGYGGMTLRDYFAAKAMQAYDPDVHSDDKIATWAYATADAMIKAREE